MKYFLIALIFAGCVLSNEEKKPAIKNTNTQFCKPILSGFVYYWPVKENRGIRLCYENGVCSSWLDRYIVKSDSEYVIETDIDLFLCEFITKKKEG